MGNWCYIEMYRVSYLLSGNGSLLGGGSQRPMTFAFPLMCSYCPWTWAGPESHLNQKIMAKVALSQSRSKPNRPGSFNFCTLESPQSTSKTESSWLTGETLSVLRPCRGTHGEGERDVQIAEAPSPAPSPPLTSHPRPPSCLQPARWIHPP